MFRLELGEHRRVLDTVTQLILNAVNAPVAVNAEREVQR
jgi:hypothetical protein